MGGGGGGREDHSSLEHPNPLQMAEAVVAAVSLRKHDLPASSICI
jgi:hypothetical protein